VGPVSAGLLLHRTGEAGRVEVLLAHMGGPLWAKRERAWTLPKGLVEAGEDPHAAALREFAEELGVAPPATSEPDLALGHVRQAGGKVVHAWARAADLDVEALRWKDDEGRWRVSTAVIAWPPRSGRTLEVPEVDRAHWFGLDEARPLVVAAQTELLDRLAGALAAPD
jgi:predicted NUDIX family NTP pyrophosphohydrolase